MENPFIKKRTTLKEIFNNDKELEELYNQIVELLIQPIRTPAKSCFVALPRILNISSRAIQFS